LSCWRLDANDGFGSNAGSDLEERLSDANLIALLQDSWRGYALPVDPGSVGAVLISYVELIILRPQGSVIPRHLVVAQNDVILRCPADA
jgi:hypothetical protein